MGLSSSHFPLGFLTKTLYTLLFSPIHATCPTKFIFLDFITRKVFGVQYRSLSSSLCSFLHSPLTSSLLFLFDPNILLNTLLSNTFSLLSFLNMSDQVPHPYKTTGKITVLYILNFIFLYSKPEHKIFCTEWQQALPDFNLLLISSWVQFLFAQSVPWNQLI